MRFKVVLEKEEDGGYSVHVPVLPGCHTQRGILEKDKKSLESLPEIDIVTVAV